MRKPGIAILVMLPFLCFAQDDQFKRAERTVTEIMESVESASTKSLLLYDPNTKIKTSFFYSSRDSFQIIEARIDSANGNKESFYFQKGKLMGVRTETAINTPAWSTTYYYYLNYNESTITDPKSRARHTSHTEAASALISKWQAAIK
jgi:hypothetical protein